jgi:hypothetical protein
MTFTRFGSTAMLLLQVMLTLPLLSYVKNSIYLYYTEDSSSAEFFDCIQDGNFLYCRRPFEPISLRRNNQSEECYHNGTLHLFSSLLSNNTNVSTIFHQWQSSIEKAEEYSRYIRQERESNDSRENYLCQCNNPQSFGKNCEYLLPFGTTFQMTFNWENEMKSMYPEENQFHSDILCYITYKCNSGLLCLDWRDICDGIQQCLLGYDEENCDWLEFNECEDDEYRCMNGMCIPEEYFVDGDHDCMDLSDEIQLFNDISCTFEEATVECDDRVCPPDKWSCGDGQCVHNHLAFQNPNSIEMECNSRRDQYYLCETHGERRQWTLPNGKCFFQKDYDEFINHDRNDEEECIYFSKCAISMGAEKNCPCKYNPLCFMEDLESPCSSDNIQYPYGAIVAPYLFFIYNNTREWWSKTSDYIQINGTIKCRGFTIDRQMTIPYDIKMNLKEIESILCHSNSDYQCDINSRTFNNHSYYFIDVCKQSKECISAYRINDGYLNCADRMDEEQNNNRESCLKFRHHRFRCSVEEPTCLYAKNIGDLSPDCKNNYDEWWMGKDLMLSQMKCNHKFKEDCQIIRQYISNSWNDNINQISSLELIRTKIPFRAYCDTFWNLGSKKDEDILMCSNWWVCLDEQWRCYSGQCINVSWVLDGEWDCKDASDEQSLFIYNHSLSIRNLKLISLSELNERFDALYGSTRQPFSNICDLEIEFPCFRVNISDPLINLTLKRPCINLEKLGNDEIDCVGGIDERNSLQHCNYPTMLGNTFLCQSSNICIDKLDLCKTRCPKQSDDHVLCETAKSESEDDCILYGNTLCIDGQCISKNECDKTYDCLYGEDEYMCDPTISLFQEPIKIHYRKLKESTIQNIYQHIQLSRFPINSSTIQIRTTIDIPTSSQISYYCNRGVGVFFHNGSIICFCSPHYYGDKCQFHNDRLSIILYLNLSQSIYTSSTKSHILLKLVVLFLFENETLDIQEFHVRPAFEINVVKKKIIYFVYPRSEQLLNNKRQRYFNRTNILTSHPYSIQIEIYELNINVKPRMIAIWKYPIYFDYLPNFRLSKILRLIKLEDIKNPCSSNPCPSDKECYPLINQLSIYICSNIDEKCLEGFCSPNALCKPNYRNEIPYCICPLNHHGRRCELLNDICLSNPCQNNGQCFPSSKPDQFTCKCSSSFYGDLCEFQTKVIVLYINESVCHESAVVQYFHINYFSLDLVLDHQNVFRKLPHVLFYHHGVETISDIIVAKLYLNRNVEIYLISIEVINQTTYINETNACKHVRLLFELEISPFQYHSLCINNVDLICFIDDVYLCICNENHSSVECFGYDSNLDQCSYCLSNGKCIKGDRSRENDFICLCPNCHRGSLCQFNTEIQSFSLDSLLIECYFNIQILYLIVVIIIFMIGALNNYASFVTFKRSKPFKVGVGKYLLLLSLISQCSLLLLFIKTIQSIFHLFSNNISCKLISFILSVCTRYSFWLTSWITLYRLHSILFPFSNLLKKSSMIYSTSFITLIIVGTMHIHELIFYITIKDPDGQMMCVGNFTHSVSIYNRITVLTHYMIPFCIQIVSITILIILAARTRSRATSNDRNTFMQILKQQFNNHKELYITPLIIVLSSLPQVILAFSFACNEPLIWQRHVLISGYFLSYAPQVLGFILFVLPSTSYSKEFRETSIAKTCLFRWIFPQKPNVKLMATSRQQDITTKNKTQL